MVPSEQRPGSVCSRCGGSGMLRLGDQSFRTCLDCLGQGRLQPLSPATTTAAAQMAAPAAASPQVPQPLAAEAEVVAVAAISRIGSPGGSEAQGSVASAAAA